jgi:hypothetical protein
MRNTLLALTAVLSLSACTTMMGDKPCPMCAQHEMKKEMPCKNMEKGKPCDMPCHNGKSPAHDVMKSTKK